MKIGMLRSHCMKFNKSVFGCKHLIWNLRFQILKFQIQEFQITCSYMSFQILIKWAIEFIVDLFEILIIQIHIVSKQEISLKSKSILKSFASKHSISFFCLILNFFWNPFHSINYVYYFPICMLIIYALITYLASDCVFLH